MHSRVSAHPLSIRDLLELCQTIRSECEDIRDKIYRLVGLLDDIEWQGLKPDYAKTLAQQYVGVWLARLATNRKVQLSSPLALDKTMLRVERLLEDSLFNKGLPSIFESLKSMWLPSQNRNMQSTRVGIETIEVAISRSKVARNCCK